MSGCADVKYSHFTRLAFIFIVCVPGVFSKCHNNDEERARKLLVRASPLWGRTTCLRLALEADDKNFVAQSGVQVEQSSGCFFLIDTIDIFLPLISKFNLTY